MTPRCWPSSKLGRSRIADLAAVKGMGPARVERYGAEILAALENS